MFPVKGTRNIIVDDQSYCWRINNRNHYLILLCRKNDINKSIIEVTIDSHIHKYWIKFPNIQDINLQPITSRIVANIINKALELGWNPYDNKLIKYSFNIEESKLSIIE